MAWAILQTATLSVAVLGVFQGFQGVFQGFVAVVRLPRDRYCKGFSRFL